VAAAVVLVLAAACTKNNNANTPSTPSCTVTAGTISASSFAAAGGTGSVPVTAGTGCTWTATSSATFVTITSGASGSGNGTVNFTVAGNSGASRTATLTIGGTSFTVSQSAAAPTSPGSLTAPTANAPIGGQSVTDTRPTLVVNNATASGTVGTVTYRFEISDLPTFPNEPVRTFTVDGIAQGSGTTSWQLNRDLGPDVLWSWHARATDGTTTSAYSATETFRTVGPCSITVSPTSFSVSGAGASIVVTVGAGSTCNWTATSNASFITITSAASGTGSGTLSASVAANTGAARTGTVTIGGQTVTVNQSAGGGTAISVSFRMRDPAVSGASPTTECRITSSTGSTCALESTSFPLGTNGLVKFDWAVQFTDGDVRTFSQSGADSTFSFSWTCGGPQSTTEGASQPLSVTLTVTDSNGATASASAGSGNQPPLFVRLFKC